VLDALGLPNDEGRLSWPLGLRVLGPAQEMQEVRLRIDSLLQAAVSQGASNSAAPGVLEEMDRAVARMRALLRDNGDGLAEATQHETRRFLGQLKRAVKTLQ
jgi:hypothetical protein